MQEIGAATPTRGGRGGGDDKRYGPATSNRHAPRKRYRRGNALTPWPGILNDVTPRSMSKDGLYEPRPHRSTRPELNPGRGDGITTGSEGKTGKDDLEATLR